VASLDDLRGLLPSPQFFTIDQSVVLNTTKIAKIPATAAEHNFIAVQLVDGSLEWLTASRRAFSKLRRILPDYPRRRLARRPPPDRDSRRH
jgi:hypothetical protein